MRLAILALVARPPGLLPRRPRPTRSSSRSSRPADLQLYTVVVPTEDDAPTTEVALKVPEGIDFLLVKETPGWEVKIERANDRIDVIRWLGSSPPDQFAEFRLIARNPILEGLLPGGSRRPTATARRCGGSARKGASFPLRSRP